MPPPNQWAVGVSAPMYMANTTTHTITTLAVRRARPSPRESRLPPESRPIPAPKSTARITEDARSVRWGKSQAATTAGIGTALATSATERLLDLAEFDRVMVVGIAGGVGPSVGIGDIVIPEVVVDGSSGNEYRPAPIDGPTPRGSIVTSDDFIVD